MAYSIRTYEITQNQGAFPGPAPEGERFVAIIRRGPNLASFTFAATEEEAEGKAEAFVAANPEPEPRKPRAPKDTTPAEEIEEAI